MTNVKSEYVLQAESWLKKHGVEFKINYLKHGAYFPDDKEERDIYEFELSRNGQSYKGTFGQSLNDSGMYYLPGKYGNISAFTQEKMPEDFPHQSPWKRRKERIAPSAYDVLSGLTKYNPGPFEEFCQEYGYNTDKIKDKKVYQAVVKEWLGISRLLPAEALEELGEIN